MEFPVVFDNKEVRCTTCGRYMTLGQPYSSHIVGMDGDKILVIYTCVYCQAPPDFSLEPKKFPVLWFFSIILFIFISFFILIMLGGIVSL